MKADDNEAFVRAFQSAHGLRVDGWAGKDTLAALGGVPAASGGISAPSPLDARSEDRLKGVDARLADVVRRAKELSQVPFMVIEGLRTPARQTELYAQGRTKPGPVVTWTMKSKHLEGRAVDIVPYENGKIDWNDLSNFNALYRAMMKAAGERGVALRYGGDWDGDGKLREKGESDSPHFELG